MNHEVKERMKIIRSVRLNLSCYCCGGIDFENIEMNWENVEDMYFLHDAKQLVKCKKCGLEDHLHNLIPRGFLHEEVV